MASVLPITHVFLLVFGLLTIAGGVLGFVKANSKPSLIAGGVAGLALLAAWWLMGAYGRPGVILGLVVSLALAGRFVGAYRKSKKMMPAGMMAILSVIGIVLTALSLVA